MKQEKYILPPHEEAPAEQLQQVLQNKYSMKISAELREKLLSLTLAAFIPLFAWFILNQARKRRSPITAETQSRHLHAAAKHWTGMTSIALRDLVDDHIGQMCQALQEAKIPGTELSYADGAYNTFIWAVGRLLKFLAARPLKLIHQDKLADMLAVIDAETAPPSSVHDAKLPNPQERRAIIDYVEQQCCSGGERRLRSLIVFYLLLFFGVRRGMAHKLYPHHVHLETGEITIIFNKQRNGRHVEITFRMPEPLKAALKRLITEFPPKAGEPLLKFKNISTLLDSAGKAAGFLELNARTFRKLFITRALEVGLDVPTIALIVGHRDGGQSILDHYHQYRPEHIQASVEKVNSEYNTPDDQAWITTLTSSAQHLSGAGARVPVELRPLLRDHLHMVTERIVAKDWDGLRSCVRSVGSNLPNRPSYQAPFLPRVPGRNEKITVAANVRTLFWKKGVSYWAIVEKTKLPIGSIYRILQGRSQTDDNLEKIAEYFQTTVAALRNPTLIKYSTELVINNVAYVAKLFGTRNLPCGGSVAAIANVANGRHLPSGSVLKSLAEFLEISLEEFLTTDISHRKDLVPPVELVPVTIPREERVAQHNNLKAVLQESLLQRMLLKFLNVTEVAELAEIRLNQCHDYFAARHYPPAENLEKLAKLFGVSTEFLLTPVPPLNAIAIGARISALLSAKKRAASTAALEMGIASAKFRRVAVGLELPNGEQLKRICGYFNVTPEYVLGIGGAAASQQAEASPEPPEMPPQVGSAPDSLAA